MKGPPVRHLAQRGALLPDLASDGRGVVLVAVLWISALVMWFALQIGAETRLQGEDQIQSIRKSQATHLAIGGCYEALARIGQPAPLHADAPPDLNWQPDGLPRIVEYRTGLAMVIIESEDRKVNVNKADHARLKLALEKAGANEDISDRLADTVMDFIDQDDTPRVQGAERDAYIRAGLNYVPFNGAITSLDQLLLIPGITDRLFYGYGGRTGARQADVPEIYRDFLVPGKYSLFSMLTIYGKGSNLPQNFDEEEVDPRPVSWKPGGTYRILSFGMSVNGPPSAGMWLTVRFSPEDKNSYKVLSRKLL